jgi:hypothetical protein
MEDYHDWAMKAIPRVMAGPGLVEFRAYRPVTGNSQVVVTYEFGDLATWAAFYADEEIQEVMDELRTVAHNVSAELWGPSPVVPKPMRPGE